MLFMVWGLVRALKDEKLPAYTDGD
jgi:hypothetical protein